MPALLVEGRERTREDATLLGGLEVSWGAVASGDHCLRRLHWDRRLLAGAGRGRWAALLLGRIPLARTYQTIRDGHGIHPVPGLLGRCWPR